jgi:hypothetical protein
LSTRLLEQGIDAMQAGSTAEGARLIRIALKIGALEPDLAAIGCMWLAEAETTPAQKRARYQQALAADPGNAEAKARLNRLLLDKLPAAPSAAAPASPATAAPVPTMAAPAPAASGPINVADHIASIFGGPSGPGTAFFVVAEGVLATTRHVVGGLEHVTVGLLNGRQMNGDVIRSYPSLDLAFIRIDYTAPGLLPVTPLPRLPDETPLYVFHYTGDMLPASQRPTQRLLQAQWIPTTFDHLLDAGGGPMFDGSGQLVGMITTATGRTSGYLYGLHIHAIRDAFEGMYQELRGEQRAYCPACGALSAAVGVTLPYCEFCGGVLPYARQITRHPQPRAATFYDANAAPCSTCHAAVGIYQGHCLRCGAQQ